MQARQTIQNAVTFSVFSSDAETNSSAGTRLGASGSGLQNKRARRRSASSERATLGEDPSAARMALRNSITMATLCAEYVADMDAHRINGKKQSTIYTDKSRIRKYIAPQLGKLKVVSVTQSLDRRFCGWPFSC